MSIIFIFYDDTIVCSTCPFNMIPKPSQFVSVNYYVQCGTLIQPIQYTVHIPARHGTRHDVFNNRL